MRGHCSYHRSVFLSSFFGPGGLHAPCLRAPCLRAPCVAWPLLLPSFSLFFSLSLCLRLLLFTHFGETPVCEIIFAPIFWHNQKIYAKKIVGIIFIFFTGKIDFLAYFQLFTASVRSRPSWPPAVHGVFAYTFGPISAILIEKSKFPAFHCPKT